MNFEKEKLRKETTKSCPKKTKQNQNEPKKEKKR